MILRPTPLLVLLHCLVMATTLGWPSAAYAETKLEAGDVIELVIAGAQPITQRAAIGRDGELNLASAGSFNAAGLTLAELRSRVQERLVSRVFYTRSIDGRDRPTSIEAGDIAVRVAEYRPVYVNGDVSKPGEQPFRPGLTVRQAIAVAGGLDVARFRVKDPFLDAAEFRSEYEALWTEYANALAEKLRIDADLQGKRDIATAGFEETPLGPKVTQGMIEMAGRRLATSRANLDQDKQHLRRLIGQLDEQITLLREQQEQEREGLKADREEAEGTQALLKRGITSATRTTEARRAFLLSSTRLLQTGAQLSEMSKQREEARRKLDKLDEQYRADLLRELQEADVRVLTLRAKIRGVSEKLLYAGVMKSQLVRGSGGKPQLAVFRKTETGRTRIEATEDTELIPSDVVEVTLALETPLGPPAEPSR
ncbi:polysaccharide biosynthesis/export family protein [Salinarimonas soli]|uniref:Exopolysaccharide biosynthesis protein n=1 Tax=Salinarimonas soli TaxID=1638099 RepID=A0A5B2V5I5_9HYPH|nr:polysaccharide biosynthesis/export family protein [Salinarimonas soli]KAA2234783.1 exopolysaccharide biosynthesis protein [Salinarimonas soli]